MSVVAQAGAKMHSLFDRVRSKFTGDADSRELATKSLTAMVIRVVGLVVNYGFLYYVTTTHGVAAWGLFVLCYTLLQMLSMLSSLGFSMSMVKLMSAPDVQRDQLIPRVMSIVVTASAIVAAVVFCCASYISPLFTKGNMTPSALRLVALGIVPFSILLVNAGIYRGLKKIVAYTFFDSLGRFAFGLISVILVSMVMTGELVVVTGFCIGLVLLLIFSTIGLIGTVLPPSDEPAQKMSAPELVSLSTSMLWGTLTNRGLRWFSALILGAYVQNAGVGVFDTSMRLTQITSIILFSINSISAPRFAEASSDEKRKKLARSVRKTSKLIVWLSVPPSLLLIFAGPWILSYFGPEFADAKWVLIVLLVGAIVNYMTGSVGTLMQMAGLHHQFRNLLVVVLVIHIGLSLFVAPRYGVLGIAAVYSLSRAAKNLIASWMVYRKMGISTIYIPGLTPNLAK